MKLFQCLRKYEVIFIVQGFEHVKSVVQHFEENKS